MKGMSFPDSFFNKEELENTPRRIRKFQRELEKLRDFKFTVFENPNYDQLIVLKDIDFCSFCSHHLLPFFGKAHIGYLPDKKICGVSKLARAVDKFASKPQVQEKLTNEIADFIYEKLNPKFLMVVVEGKHLCMQMRGVKKSNAVMITSAIRTKEDITYWHSLKEELLSIIFKG